MKIEGFCWNLINGTRSSNDLKFRVAPIGVNDVGAMTLHLCKHQLLSNSLILAIGNSSLINKYTESYINFTVNFQVNDCKQIPIVIPDEVTISDINHIVDAAIKIKQETISDAAMSNIAASEKLNVLQKQLDILVRTLYMI